MNETLENTLPEIKTKRIIGRLEGTQKGPTLVFFGGIHGNEMAGVKALEYVFGKLEDTSEKLKGTMIGIRGNIPAQMAGKRFLKSDLNRLWTAQKIEAIQAKQSSEREHEEQELAEIYQLILELLIVQSPPFYFIDFHTTSSKTLPFITINDALINRKFSQLFPVPVILGIEEYLEGPLLSHMNEKGYVSLGFESGRHKDLQAIKNSISFLWLALVFTRALEKSSVPDFEYHYNNLKESANNDSTFYEVVHRYAISSEETFKMYNGFKSFGKVSMGTPIAIHNEREIKAEKDTILFMPLYQDQGEEGFFLIQPIPKWALKLSVFLRKIKFDTFLTYLLGVSWSDDKKGSLSVNTKVARFFTKSFFHLLGYRNKVRNQNHLIMSNRERTANNEMYKYEWWYNG